MEYLFLFWRRKLGRNPYFRSFWLERSIVSHTYIKLTWIRYQFRCMDTFYPYKNIDTYSRSLDPCVRHSTVFKWEGKKKTGFYPSPSQRIISSKRWNYCLNFPKYLFSNNDSHKMCADTRHSSMYTYNALNLYVCLFIYLSVFAIESHTVGVIENKIYSDP